MHVSFAGYDLVPDLDSVKVESEEGEISRQMVAAKYFRAEKLAPIARKLAGGSFSIGPVHRVHGSDSAAVRFIGTHPDEIPFEGPLKVIVKDNAGEGKISHDWAVLESIQWSRNGCRTFHTYRFTVGSKPSGAVDPTSDGVIA